MENISPAEAKAFLKDHGYRLTKIIMKTDGSTQSWPDMELREFLEKVRDDRVVVYNVTLLVFGAGPDGADIKISGLGAMGSLMAAIEEDDP